METRVRAIHESPAFLPSSEGGGARFARDGGRDKIRTNPTATRPLKNFGVYYDEGPPVPIPNTVVKLIRAEDTWLEAARENRSMPTFRKVVPQ